MKNGNSGSSLSNPFGSMGTSNKFHDNSSGSHKFSKFNNGFTGAHGFNNEFMNSESKMNEDRFSSDFHGPNGFANINKFNRDESTFDEFGNHLELTGADGSFEHKSSSGFDKSDSSQSLDERNECTRDIFGRLNCSKSKNQSQSSSTASERKEHHVFHDPHTGLKTTSTSHSSSTSSSSSSSSSHSSSGRRLETLEGLLVPGLEKSSAL